MSLEAGATLPKPPRLSASGNGYDWREFDRWLQRLYIMLGVPNSINDNANVIQALENLDIENSMSFVIDHQQEIRDLSGRIDELAIEIHTMTVDTSELKRLAIRLDEISNELGTITNNHQEIAQLRILIEDTQNAVNMGA